VGKVDLFELRPKPVDLFLFRSGRFDAEALPFADHPAHEGELLGEAVAGHHIEMGFVVVHGSILPRSRRTLHCDRGDLEGVVLHHEVVVRDEDVLPLALGAPDGEATLEEDPGAVLGAEDDEVTRAPLVLVAEAVRVRKGGDHAESLGGEFLERFHGPTLPLPE
jgi:hypothetical protein